MAGDTDASSPYVKCLHHGRAPSIVVEVVPVEAVSEVVVDEGEWVIVVVLEKVAVVSDLSQCVDFDRSCDSLRAG